MAPVLNVKVQFFTWRRMSKTRRPSMSARNVSWLEVEAMRDWERTQAALYIVTRFTVRRRC